MGSQASKPARSLPKSLNQVANSAVKSKTGVNPITQNKISFVHKETEGVTGGGNEGVESAEQLNIQKELKVKEEERAKENAKRMGFIKLEEIPIKLDQNVSDQLPGTSIDYY